MNTSNLKPFRLEEFKSNEETPVVHADGDRAWIVFPPSWNDLDFPVAAIYKSGQTGRYSKTGVPHTMNGEVRLFFAPRKKVVPLSLEDIKPGMALRPHGAPIVRFPTAAGKSGVTFGSSSYVGFEALQRSHEYSFDCLTWHRCEKEVEA